MAAISVIGGIEELRPAKASGRVAERSRNRQEALLLLGERRRRVREFESAVLAKASILCPITVILGHKIDAPGRGF